MKAPSRIDVPCPLCGNHISLPLAMTPTLAATTSCEVWITATISLGGATHRCPKIEGQIPKPNPRDEDYEWGEDEMEKED